MDVSHFTEAMPYQPGTINRRRAVRRHQVLAVHLPADQAVPTQCIPDAERALEVLHLACLHALVCAGEDDLRGTVLDTRLSQEFSQRAARPLRAAKGVRAPWHVCPEAALDRHAPGAGASHEHWVRLGRTSAYVGHGELELAIHHAVHSDPVRLWAEVGHVVVDQEVVRSHLRDVLTQRLNVRTVASLGQLQLCRRDVIALVGVPPVVRLQGIMFSP